jgi:hypothetical protein
MCSADVELKTLGQFVDIKLLAIHVPSYRKSLVRLLVGNKVCPDLVRHPGIFLKLPSILLNQTFIKSLSPSQELFG